MAGRSVREWGEAIAVLGVVSSLVFVGFELRNNGRAARAAAYQELGVAVADAWMVKATDRELNDLVNHARAVDPAMWESFSESDRNLVDSYVMANLRLMETVYLQVDQKLLPPEALELLGWGGFAETHLLQRTWPRVRGRVTPPFAAYLENRAPSLRDP